MTELSCECEPRDGNCRTIAHYGPPLERADRRPLEVDSADIIKGYEVGKGDYIELDPEELEAVAIESKRTIDIDEFVPKDEIDELYLKNPYYIAPTEKSVSRHSQSSGEPSARRAW